MILYWRYHTSDRDKVRVWRENWIGEQFEIVSKDEFEVLKHFAFLFNIQLIRKED
jgi:hypothetical protein